MFTQRDIIYQLFLGRIPSANVLDHQNQVLHQLAALPWQRLVSRGITHVYLLGIWDNQGPILVTQEDGVDLSDTSMRTPSIFAISNHTQVNPLLGNMDQLKALVSVLEQHKLKALVDFVPNHTSTVHSWVATHPDYYSQSEKGFVAEFSGDVYKLNYENPQTALAMQEVLLTIAQTGVHGVRVDMAHLVPISFWREAISQVRSKYPDFLFIAEAYATSLFDTKNLIDLTQAGFDLIYHESLYRNIKKYIQNHEPLVYVTEHLEFYLNHNPVHFLNYISNHDDPSVGKLKELLSLLLLLPSPLLLYNGALQGFGERLAHHTLEILPSEFDDFAFDSTPLDHFINLRMKGHSVTSLKLVESTLELTLLNFQESIHIPL